MLHQHSVTAYVHLINQDVKNLDVIKVTEIYLNNSWFIVSVSIGPADQYRHKWYIADFPSPITSICNMLTLTQLCKEIQLRGKVLCDLAQIKVCIMKLYNLVVVIFFCYMLCNYVQIYVFLIQCSLLDPWIHNALL